MVKTSWGELFSNKGVVTTNGFLINSNKNSLLLDMNMEAILNNKDEIKVEYSISYDYETWTEWNSLLENNVIIINNTYEQDIMIKFRVTLYANNLEMSPILQSITFTNQDVFKVENVGDFDCKPKLWITKTKGDGDVKLYNTKSHEVLILSNLKKGEQVFIDCDNEQIITDLPLTYRYDNHNDVFTTFFVGDNYLYGEGDFILDLKFQSNLL